MKTSTPHQPIRKGIFLSLLLVLGTNFLFAQGSYFKFGIGYGFAAGSQLLGENYSSSSNYNTNSYTSTEKGIYGSLGSGLVVHTSYGHMYSKNIGLDISLQYLVGRKYTSNNSSTYLDFNNAVTTSSSESAIQAHGLLFSPAVVFSAGDGSIRPYTKIGFVIGSIKFATEDQSHYANQSFEMKTEFKGGLSFGFRGGVGLDFSASKKINFFTELMLTSMSYYPRESEITKYKVNGKDQDPQHRKITYEKEVTRSTITDSDKQLRFAAPLGNFVLSFGIKINIAKQVAAKASGTY